MWYGTVLVKIGSMVRPSLSFISRFTVDQAMGQVILLSAFFTILTWMNGGAKQAREKMKKDFVPTLKMNT